MFNMGNWIINNGLTAFILVSSSQLHFGNFTFSIVKMDKLDECTFYARLLFCFCAQRTTKCQSEQTIVRYIITFVEGWFICDRSVFAGGLDGHQHFPFRLVLPLLRLEGRVFLHAPSLRGESYVIQGVSSAHVAIITIIITIIIDPSSLPWLGPELLLLFSTLTAC